MNKDTTWLVKGDEQIIIVEKSDEKVRNKTKKTLPKQKQTSQSILAISTPIYFLPRFPFLGLPFLRFIFPFNTGELT